MNSLLMEQEVALLRFQINFVIIIGLDSRRKTRISPHSYTTTVNAFRPDRTTKSRHKTSLPTVHSLHIVYNHAAANPTTATTPATCTLQLNAAAPPVNCAGGVLPVAVGTVPFTVPFAVRFVSGVE